MAECIGSLSPTFLTGVYLGSRKGGGVPLWLRWETGVLHIWCCSPVCCAKVGKLAIEIMASATTERSTYSHTSRPTSASSSGPQGFLLGQSWERWGPSWVHIGGHRSKMMWILSRPPVGAFKWASWGALGALLGRSWALLGPSWAPLGLLLGPSWAILEPS